MNYTRIVAVVGAAVLAAACNGIGDGNTVETLEIVPASNARLVRSFEAGDTYPLYQCLRDELVLIGTFGDGQRVQFNSRATWTSSDESVVQVSNRDIGVQTIIDGEFSEITTQPYAAGTLIPTGNVGEEADITAEFVGLSATIRVQIRKPELRIVPTPHPATANPLDFVPPVYLGVGTRQSLQLIGNFEGRLATSLIGGALNTSLNAVRWTFPDGEFELDDEEKVADYDKWSVPDAATRFADLDGGGTVRGRVASASEYQVAAELSLCPAETDPDLKPTVNVRVLPFDQTTPVSMDYQPDFHAAGSFSPTTQFATEEMVDGTEQRMPLIGHLDVDGDGIGDVEQDLSTQAAFEISPRDVGCDDNGLNCFGNSLVTATAGSGLVTAERNSGGRLEDGFDLVCLTDPENVECVAETDPDPDPVAVQACLAVCPPRLASLEAEVSGETATLTASVFGLDAAPTFVFDCGDGSAVQDTGGNPMAQCDYSGDTGPFLATVRVLDGSHAVTRNAGAVLVNLGTVPAENTPPAAALSATPSTGGSAPLSVLLSGSGSNDADEEDELTVYEFQPEPGVIVRQSSPQLTWIYTGQPASNPTLVVYDSFGVASEPASVEVIIENSYGDLLRSAPLTVTSVEAMPCALEIVPPEPATETAFSFPGIAFGVVAAFIAEPAAEGDEESDPCDTEPLIGTQDAIGDVFWTVRPDAESEEVSEYVTVRSTNSSFQRAGQTLWLDDPGEETMQAVIAQPASGTIYFGLDNPPPATLTIQPCDPEQCTQ